MRGWSFSFIFDSIFIEFPRFAVEIKPSKLLQLDSIMKSITFFQVCKQLMADLIGKDSYRGVTTVLLCSSKQ